MRCVQQKLLFENKLKINVKNKLVIIEKVNMPSTKDAQLFFLKIISPILKKHLKEKFLIHKNKFDKY